MTKKKTTKAEAPIADNSTDEARLQKESEFKAASTVAEHGYQNTSGGLFEVFGVEWAVDEVKDVPEDLEKEKKFKHAVSLGCLTEV